MSTVIRHVRDIDREERRVLEHVVGEQLKENQKIIIQVVTLDKRTIADTQKSDSERSDQLPAWFNVYEGLTESEIDDLEKIILLRANLTRPSA